jgi:hypothetical protein
MAAAFQFPDETGDDGPNKDDTKDKLEIDIVDDTPEPDKGREPLPKEIIEDIEKDDLKEYSEKVQTRLKTLKKAYHDERRAKETASRERDEAASFARAKDQEVSQLKQRLGTGEKIFITEATTSAKAQLDTAREKLRQANASGDADLISTAQESLYDAKSKLERAESLRPTLQEQNTGVQTTSQVQTQNRPKVDPKAEAWRSKNGWFGVDKKMTALALGLHEELVESGVNPSSDDYYKAVDADMKKRFPEYFSDGDDTAKTSRKPATVVASASRSTGPRRIQLTTSQVALAKRLGLTNEAYAREMMRIEESKNG